MTIIILKLWLWRGLSLCVFLIISAMLVYAFRHWMSDRRMFANGYTTSAFVEKKEAIHVDARIGTQLYVTVSYRFGEDSYRKRLRVSQVAYDGVTEGTNTTIMYNVEDAFGVYLLNDATRSDVMQNYLARFLIGGLFWAFTAFWVYATFFWIKR